MPLGPYFVRRPSGIGRGIPIDRVPTGRNLHVGEGGGRTRCLCREGPVTRRPVDAEIGQAQNDLGRRNHCGVLVDGGLLAERRAREWRDR